MPRQIAKGIGEKLLEQGKHTGKGLKQAPKTIFQRIVGEKTDEEKQAQKDQEEAEKEQGASSGGQQQTPTSQADWRSQQIETERQAKNKQMQKILHKRIFDEAEKVRRRKVEEENLKKMQEEDEQKKKQEKQTDALEQKEKEEALAVKVAKRAKGAGEFGPRKPK